MSRGQLKPDGIAQIADGLRDVAELERRVRALAALVPAPATSLPNAPADGQQVCLLADAANGVEWLLRYRSASTNAYRWELLGGSEVVSVGSTNTISAGSYTAMTGAASVTAPFAGVYDLTFGTRMQSGFAGQWSAAVTPSNSLVDSTAAIGVVGGSGSTVSRPQNTLRATLTASQVVSLMARSFASTGTDMFEPFIRIRPVMVG